MSQDTFSSRASDDVDKLVMHTRDELVELAELIASNEGVSQVDRCHVAAAWKQFLENEVA
jgi:aconitase B